MTTPHDCDHCGKFSSFITKVDFGYGGIEDCDCPEWDRMTDEETELSNEGKCPYWVSIKDDQFGDYDPEEVNE